MPPLDWLLLALFLFLFVGGMISIFIILTIKRFQKKAERGLKRFGVGFFEYYKRTTFRQWGNALAGGKFAGKYVELGFMTHEIIRGLILTAFLLAVFTGFILTSLQDFFVFGLIIIVPFIFFSFVYILIDFLILLFRYKNSVFIENPGKEDCPVCNGKKPDIGTFAARVTARQITCYACGAKFRRDKKKRQKKSCYFVQRFVRAVFRSSITALFGSRDTIAYIYIAVLGGCFLVCMYVCMLISNMNRYYKIAFQPVTKDT